jgi:hypothetical protein
MSTQGWYLKLKTKESVHYDEHPRKGASEIWKVW